MQPLVDYLIENAANTGCADDTFMDQKTIHFHLDEVTKQHLVVLGGVPQWDEDFNNDYSVSDNEQDKAKCPRKSIKVRKNITDLINEDSFEISQSELSQSILDEEDLHKLPIDRIAQMEASHSSNSASSKGNKSLKSPPGSVSSSVK